MYQKEFIHSLRFAVLSAYIQGQSCLHQTKQGCAYRNADTPGLACAIGKLMTDQEAFNLSAEAEGANIHNTEVQRTAFGRLLDHNEVSLAAALQTAHDSSRNANQGMEWRAVFAYQVDMMFRRVGLDPMVWPVLA